MVVFGRRVSPLILSQIILARTIRGARGVKDSKVHEARSGSERENVRAPRRARWQEGVEKEKERHGSRIVFAKYQYLRPPCWYPARLDLTRLNSTDPAATHLPFTSLPPLPLPFAIFFFYLFTSCPAILATDWHAAFKNYAIWVLLSQRWAKRKLKWNGREGWRAVAL